MWNKWDIIKDACDLQRITGYVNRGKQRVSTAAALWVHSLRKILRNENIMHSLLLSHISGISICEIQGILCESMLIKCLDIRLAPYCSQKCNHENVHRSTGVHRGWPRTCISLKHTRNKQNCSTFCREWTVIRELLCDMTKNKQKILQVLSLICGCENKNRVLARWLLVPCSQKKRIISIIEKRQGKIKRRSPTWGNGVHSRAACGTCEWFTGAHAAAVMCSWLHNMATTNGIKIVTVNRGWQLPCISWIWTQFTTLFGTSKKPPWYLWTGCSRLLGHEIVIRILINTNSGTCCTLRSEALLKGFQ